MFFSAVVAAVAVTEACYRLNIAATDYIICTNTGGFLLLPLESRECDTIRTPVTPRVTLPAGQKVSIFSLVKSVIIRILIGHGASRIN